jgi:hypothetical protein
MAFLFLKKKEEQTAQSREAEGTISLCLKLESDTLPACCQAAAGGSLRTQKPPAYEAAAWRHD